MRWHPMTRLGCTLTAAVLASGCLLPDRDNPSDPAVRPQAVAEIRIGDAPASEAPRAASWVFDCAASFDDGGIRRCRWELSDGPGGTVEPGEVGWIEVGERDRDEPVESRPTPEPAEPTALRSALASIHDFESFDDGATAGTGSTRRWVRLTVEDTDGNEDTALRPIVVTNFAPTISLGGDRVVAAGGRWWEGGLPAYAQPFRVTLTAEVSDQDGDTVSPPVWEVTGDLAPRFDRNVDGRIDPEFLSTDGLRFELDASLTPSRGSVTVSVSDVTRPDGTLSAVASSTSSIDVANTRWFYDGGVGRLRRLVAPSRSEGGNPFPEWILATDRRQLLRRSYGGDTATYRAAHTTWTAVHDGVFGDTDPFEQQADVDGAGGWWTLGIVDPDGFGGPDPAHGVVCHLAFAGTSACFDDPDGDLDWDFTSDPAGIQWTGSATDVWVVGGEGAAASTRLYRLTEQGSRTVDVAATAGSTAGTKVAALAATGADAVFAFLDGPSTDDRLRQFGPDGSLLLDEPVPADCYAADAPAFHGMRIAPRTGFVWVVATKHRLCRRSPDGTWTALTSPANGPGTPLPSRDGEEVQLVRSSVDTSVLRLLTYDARTLVLRSSRFFPRNGAFDTNGELHSIGERGVAGVCRTGGAVYFDLFIDGDTLENELGVDVPVGPLSYSKVRHVTDPATGWILVWNPDDAAIETRHPDGTLARVDAVESAVAEVVLLAIDAVDRTLWVASSGGNLERWELGERASDPPVITTYDALDSVHDLAVSPASGARPARLFVAGQRSGSSTSAFAWSVDDESATDLDLHPLTNRVAVDGATGAAWFLPTTTSDPFAFPISGGEGAWVDASLAVTTFAADTCAMRDVVVPPWDGIPRVTSSENGGCPGWLLTLDSAGTPAAVSVVSGTISMQSSVDLSFTDRTAELAIDPIYERVLVGIDHLANSPAPGGFLIWLEGSATDMEERSATSGLFYPELP